jgi:hypothetical protein
MRDLSAAEFTAANFMLVHGFSSCAHNHAESRNDDRGDYHSEGWLVPAVGL